MLKLASKYVFKGILSSVLLFLLLGSERAQAATLTYHFTTQELINRFNDPLVAPPGITAANAILFEFFVTPVITGPLTNYQVIGATSPIPIGIDMYQVSASTTTPTNCTSGATPTCASGPNFARYFINTGNSKIAYVTQNASVANKTYTITDLDPPINGQVAEVMALNADWGITITTSDVIAPTTGVTFAWELFGHKVNLDGTMPTPIQGKTFSAKFNITEAQIPEPNTILLFGGGLLSIYGVRFWRRSKRAI
jgi:hypothetical protein